MSRSVATETDAPVRVHKGEWALLALLVVLVVVCAVGVVLSVHQTRLGYAALQSLEAARDALEGDYERLLLEQGAFADSARVDQVAREQLGMYTPPTREVENDKGARCCWPWHGAQLARPGTDRRQENNVATLARDRGVRGVGARTSDTGGLSARG